MGLDITIHVNFVYFVTQNANLQKSPENTPSKPKIPIGPMLKPSLEITSQKGKNCLFLLI